VGQGSTLAVTIIAVVSALALIAYGFLLFDDLNDAPAQRIEFVTPFLYDASGDDNRNLNGEYITLMNRGELPVDMSGWTLRNALRVTLTIPDGFVLPPESTVTVYSGCGEDTSDALYWCSEREVWDNNSGAATLLDAEGTKIAAHYYQRLCETCGSKRETEDDAL